MGIMMSQLRTVVENISTREPISRLDSGLDLEPLDGGFDYESKVWGANEVRLSPSHLNALRLKYCLDDLKGVHGRLLEVGCGAGGMSRSIKFYRPDLDVYGCDISEVAIRLAQKRSGGVAFSVCDAYQLTYPRDSFSAVVLFDVLEHLELPEMAIREIYRVLKPGGLAHLFVPCEGSLYTIHGLLSRVGWRAKKDYGGHVKLFDAPSVRTTLRKQGFIVQNSRWSGHFINQLFDASYFTFLALRRNNTSSSLESYLEDKGQNHVFLLIRLAKNVVAWLSYLEASLLRKVPAWGVHLTCSK